MNVKVHWELKNHNDTMHDAQAQLLKIAEKTNPHGSYELFVRPDGKTSVELKLAVQINSDHFHAQAKGETWQTALHSIEEQIVRQTRNQKDKLVRKRHEGAGSNDSDE